MDRIKVHIICLLLCLSVAPCFGQFGLTATELQAKLNKIPQEHAFVHTPNSLFLAGEYLYYSFYGFNANTKRLTELSKVAYVELIDNNGNQIFKHKLRLENGVGSGDFFIPTATPTGAYKLIGYTNWMQNGSVESLFTTDISIINPYRSSPLVSNPTIPTDSLVRSEEQELEVISKNPSARTVQLPMNKLIYTKRELVSLDLSRYSNSLVNGYYSLSVRKQNVLRAPKLTHIDRYLDTLVSKPYDFSNVDSRSPRLPELRGELFKGKVLSKNSKSRVDQLHISISIPGDQPYFTIVKSDNNGVFYFNVDRYYSGSEIIFDVIDAEKTAYNFELIDRTFEEINKLSFHEVQIDKSDEKALVDRSVANQIENAYFKFKPDSTKIPKPRRFLDDYEGKTYLLDDFTRFKTIRETIFEYVKDVVIRRVNNDKSVVRIKGYNFGTNSLALPLVMLDGVVIQDHNALLDFESTTIASIEVYRDQFIIGPHTYQGALVVQSKSGQSPNNYTRFGLNQPMPLFRSQDVKSYFKQGYSGTQNNPRLPDYRYQLLWQPVKEFTQNDTKIEFYTSDITGNFEVLLQGVTKEGKPISAIQVFTVN